MYTVLRAGRGSKEDGVATPAVAAAAAAVLVVLTASAVLFSMAREDNASVASKSAPEQAGPEARAQMMSGVKNAATAMEEWATENGGTYAGVCDGSAGSSSCSGLTDSGLRLPPDVTVVVVSANSTGYCLRASHADLPPDDDVFYSSDVATPSEEPCT